MTQPKTSRTCVDCGCALLERRSVRCKPCNQRNTEAIKRSKRTPPNLSSLCQCGCGQPAPIAKMSCTRAGNVAGYPMRFIAGHNSRMQSKGYEIEDRGYTTKCHIWKGRKFSNGYGERKKNGHRHLAHKFAYEQEHGPVADGMELDHLCRQRDCIRVSHLEEVTHAENVRRGLATRLCRDDVLVIKAMLGTASYCHIAAVFGVSDETIRSIAHGNSWQDV